MTLKLGSHSKLDVTQKKIHMKGNDTQNGMSLKMECHLKWNVTQNEMSLKMKCQ